MQHKNRVICGSCVCMHSFFYKKNRSHTKTLAYARIAQLLCTHVHKLTHSSPLRCVLFDCNVYIYITCRQKHTAYSCFYIKKHVCIVDDGLMRAQRTTTHNSGGKSCIPNPLSLVRLVASMDDIVKYIPHTYTCRQRDCVYKRWLDYGEVKKNIQNGGYLYFRIRTTVDSIIHCLTPNKTIYRFGELSISIVFLMFRFNRVWIVQSFLFELKLVCAIETSF